MAYRALVAAGSTVASGRMSTYFASVAASRWDTSSGSSSTIRSVPFRYPEQIDLPLAPANCASLSGSAAIIAPVPMRMPETDALAPPVQHLPEVQPVQHLQEAQPGPPGSAPVPPPSEATRPPPPGPIQQVLSPLFGALP